MQINKGKVDDLKAQDKFIAGAKATAAEKIPPQRKAKPTEKGVFFNLSMSKELRQKVKLAAAKQGTPMNDYMVQILEKAVDKS